MGVKSKSASGPATARFHIDVSDSGGGIEPATLDVVFEPGFTTKDRRSHDGLGLALVKDLVTRYDGTITVDSEPGSGTLISVTLDLESAGRQGRRTVARRRCLIRRRDGAKPGSCSGGDRCPRLTATIRWGLFGS